MRRCFDTIHFSSLCKTIERATISFFIPFSPGRGWVGWKQHPLNSPQRDFIQIDFSFDAVREFHFVHVFTNNQFTRDVALFKEAKIFFSIGGKVREERLKYTRSHYDWPLVY